MFNVPPEKVGQLKVATVCLEHGKREPRAAIPYEIKPLDSVTTKPGVRELCAMLGSGQINQRAAQAAAWHLNNGMSWQELAAKRHRFANGTRPALLQPGRDPSRHEDRRDSRQALRGATEAGQRHEQIGPAGSSGQ